MSQEMNILCCFSCKMYQVHIVKKAKKWQCKICNVKQSFSRVYFQGSGKDCRIHVQKLNATKEYENQPSTSFVMGNDMHYGSCDNDCFEQTKLEVDKNRKTKYLNTLSKETLCSTFQTSNHENNRENDNSMHLSNNNMRYECFQSTPCYENNKIENSYCNGKEWDNTIAQESFNDKSNDNTDSKKNIFGKNITEAKDITNIFDDNEDFDITIDF
ncbi:MRN complex-interacting protein [Colletes gigas]|uniref:MRN complex-interacting protein n=1 Tax=Colletes gigas TaxID=935657 RepID=UPI001C9B1647|nr:MRN complex-interacting protein [Colletes gigas]